MKHLKILFICVLISALFYCTNFSEATENANKIQLTEAEKDFISNHPVINIGVDPKFVPYEFIDSDGVYKGIAADYIDLISKKTGLKFVVEPNLTWSEAYEKAVERELDVLPCISKTTNREQHFLFSNSYINFQRVIFIEESNNSIKSFEDLYGNTVAVQTNSSHHSFLSSYENINLELFDNTEDALRAVSSGKASAFVGNLATSSYIIKSFGITDLKYIVIESEQPQSLYFVVRNDWPELIGIINKALSDISEEDKIAINNKWIDIEEEIDYGPIIRIIIAIVSLALVIAAVSLYWINRLRKEIKTRKLIQIDLEKARREAVEANEYKSNFMARMSHEIRTPLNAITGTTYLLKKTPLTMMQKMYADRITQASSNMLGIINDILDYSKIEAGKVELEITSFSLDRVIQDLVNIVSYKIEEQEIGFKLSKDPQIPNWFFGDSKRIQQVLLNILNNAVKFTNNGEVSLDIRLTAKENDKYHITFSVKDTGIGMNEEQIKKLFTPFTQGDISINRRFGGTGLGLSIVKNLVDMMGGQIQVFSTPGEGSTFIISLSLNVDKDNEENYTKNLAADYFKNIKTLVLEKTGSNMNLIESYLNSFGIHCELTSSENSAMSTLEAADGKFSKPFDLVIVDYNTPNESGFKFIQSIRYNKKILNKPKVIVMLPMLREDLLDKLNEYEIDIGILKPIIPSILYDGIVDIFKLKAVSASQSEEKKDKDKSNLSTQHVVLVVEDNKTNQMIAKSLLQQEGIQSILAANGKEGLELYKEHKEIDLILMDLHMPVMNGYEAAEEIRKISKTVPIVAMTADVILGVKEKCEQSGIYKYISKPFDPDKFIKTIVDMLIDTESDTSNTQDSDIIDQNEGIKNVGGSEDIYKLVLKEYLNENKDTLDKLSNAISENRYADASQIVHKVKSSSGSIGAKHLYEISIKLQKELENKKVSEIANLHREFSLLLNKILEKICELIEYC